MRIAIDTGGTFTDCVYVRNGEVEILKLPSTPSDPALAVLNAVQSIAPGVRSEVRHGTTVGTNALLERKGARVAFVTTAGFEDAIAIGRQARPKLYDWYFAKEPPLAPENLRFGVDERIAADGSVLRSVGSAELERLKRAIAAEAPESVAVSLLFAFANPSNEQAVSAALRDLGVPVSASHEILPEFREYERGSTVLINAYLAPKMQHYLGNLHRGLSAENAALHVMQSSGGIIPATIAAREPVRTILSGPAGGVVGASSIASAAGISKILTFDMGGTSTDVALIDTAAGLRTTTEFQILGVPVAVPMLDIHTVGAGGGSIAGFDRGGALKVGPQSAGADPGPICYGRGEQPTVTDANLLLGRIDADWFLGGGMKLDEDRARTYFDQTRGRLSTAESFAEGIVRLADSHMERALRRISVEQGYDPRDFVLLSFGGAGPLHACALARALQIPRVLVPAIPGALSAYGILVSDAVRDYSRTVMLSPGDPALAEHFEVLEQRAVEDLAAQSLTGHTVQSLDLRYSGQGYELNVPRAGDYLERFHALHAQRYGYADPRRPVQIVNARVRSIVKTDVRPAKPGGKLRGNARDAVIKTKRVFFEGNWCSAAVYDRRRLMSGDSFSGPAVIVEYSATTFVPPACNVLVDDHSNMLIEVSR